MLIAEAIERCDALFPNALGYDEKLAVCYELSCRIRREAKRVFSSLVFAPGEAICLPDGATAADVVTVIADGRVLRRSSDLFLPEVAAGRTEVIFRTVPAPYHTYLYEGEAVADGNRLYLPDTEGISAGSVITVTGGENDGYHGTVAEVEEDALTLTEAFSHDGTEEVTVTVYPPYRCECPPPYDSMYVEYLIGRTLYWQENFGAAREYLAAAERHFAAYAVYEREHDAVDERKMRRFF